MKIFRILVIAGLAAVWSPLPAGVDQIWSPFDFVVSGALCPQTGDIAGTGSMHMVTRSSTDGNGVVHGGLVGSVKGTATNAAGDKWIFSDVDTLALTARPSSRSPRGFT